MTAQNVRRGEDAAALSLAGGMTRADAAKAAGISERQLYRWLEDDGFVERVAAARGVMFDCALGRLAGAAGDAASTLVALLGEDAPAHRLAAAVAILRAAAAWRAEIELAERVAQLADRVATLDERKAAA